MKTKNSKTQKLINPAPSTDESFEDQTLLADGFEKAFIGFGIQFNKTLAIYDYDKCVKVMMKRDKMTFEEAVEFMEYNVVGAYVGDFTPVFLRRDLTEEDIANH